MNLKSRDPEHWRWRQEMDISAQTESKPFLIFPLLLSFTLKGWGDVLLLCMGETRQASLCQEHSHGHNQK